MRPEASSARSPDRVLHDGNSDDSYDHEEDTPMIEKYTSTRHKRWSVKPRTMIYSLGALLLASLAGNMILLLSMLYGNSDLDTVCFKHTSEYWAPMMDDVKLRYESVLFDGSFMNKSVYQQPAGPEVDAAWSGLGIDFRTIVVPEDRGFEAGLDPSAVKVKKSQGGGYLVNVEGLHHLHCLNQIRQTLPWNVDYYRDRGAGVFLNSEPIVQLHVDHCLDIIRQQLQCTSDTGLFGQRWIQREGKDMNVFPSFDTVHKCRNFNDILDWVREHQAVDGLVAEVRDDDIILDAYP